MRLIKIALALVAFVAFNSNVNAADAVGTTIAPPFARATSLNSTGTSSTEVGNTSAITYVNGTNINITSSNESNLSTTNGTTRTDVITTANGLSISNSTSGSTNGYLSLDVGGNIQVGGAGDVTVASGPRSSGGIAGTSVLSVTNTSATLVSAGSSSYSAIGWGASGASAPADYVNTLSANQNGVAIASATALTMNATTTTITSTTNNIVGTTNNVTGTTNINTAGNANTSIGSSGTGTVTLTSGSNSVVMNNSGTTVTSPTTIIGLTNINTLGTANTLIGNSIGTVSVNGSTVNVGTNSASNITIGNGTGNSTVSMNGNRLQNVGNGTAGTDAVNLNQLNSVSGNVSSLSNSVSSLGNQVNNLNTQLQQSQTQYRSGIAGVAAMNGIGGLNAGQTVNFGIGVGGFAGQAGVAAGGNIRITDNTTFKASVAQASNNTAVSGGLTIGF